MYRKNETSGPALAGVPALAGFFWPNRSRAHLRRGGVTTGLPRAQRFFAVGKGGGRKGVTGRVRSRACGVARSAEVRRRQRPRERRRTRPRPRSARDTLDVSHQMISVLGSHAMLTGKTGASSERVVQASARSKPTRAACQASSHWSAARAHRAGRGWCRTSACLPGPRTRARTRATGGG